MNSNYVPRFGWIGFDLLTQPRDVVVDRARDGIAVVTPNLVEQLISCDDLAPTPDQVTQDLKFAR